MKADKMYIINIKALHEGVSKFQYLIDEKFFESYESELEEKTKGVFDISVEIERKPSLLKINFDIQAKISETCDRCSAKIQIPVTSVYPLVVKYSDTPGERDEVLYLLHDSYELNLKQYIYEFCKLTIPLRNIKDCESNDFKDCNKDILNILEGQKVTAQETENIFGKMLKDFNKN